MIALCLALVILLSATGLGLYLLRLLGFRFLNLYEGWFFSLGVGIALISYLLLALGVAQFWNNWVFWILLLVAAAVGIPQLCFHSKDIIDFSLPSPGVFFCKNGTKDGLIPRFARWIVWISGMVLVVLIVSNVLAAMAPVAYSDPLRLHLGVPKLYLFYGGIVYLPSIVLSDLANVMEMLYGFCLGLKDGVVAAQLHALLGASAVIVIIIFCTRFASLSAGILGASMFYVQPMLTDVGTGIYTDFGLFLFTSLTLYSLILYSKSGASRWLLLGGVFGGVAIGCKITGGFAAMAALALLLYQAYVNKWPKGRVWWAASRFCLLAGVVVAPWFIKSWVLAGNPVFPLFYKVFGGKDWNPLVDSIQKSLHGSQVSLGSLKDWLGFLMIPWSLTMGGDRFGGMASGYLPIYLAGLPSLLLVRREKASLIGPILLYSLVFMLIWYFVYFWGRWLLPVFFGLSFLLGWGLLELICATRFLFVRVATVMMILVTLILGTGINFIHNWHMWQGAIGVISEKDYLKKYVWSYNIIDYANHNLPAGSKIVLWNWVIEGYYLNHDYLFGNPTDQGYINYTQYVDPKELLQDWRRKSITHIIWDKEAWPEDIQRAPHNESPLVQQYYALRFQMLNGGFLRLVYQNQETRFAAKTLGRGARSAEVALLEVIYP